MSGPARRRGLLAWLYRLLAGSAFVKALEKNEKAADELDAALREVLGR